MLLMKRLLFQSLVTMRLVQIACLLIIEFAKGMLMETKRRQPKQNVIIRQNYHEWHEEAQSQLNVEYKTGTIITFAFEIASLCLTA